MGPGELLERRGPPAPEAQDPTIWAHPWAPRDALSMEAPTACNGIAGNSLDRPGVCIAMRSDGPPPHAPNTDTLAGREQGPAAHPYTGGTWLQQAGSSSPSTECTLAAATPSAANIMGLRAYSEHRIASSSRWRWPQLLRCYV